MMFLVVFILCACGVIAGKCSSDVVEDTSLEHAWAEFQTVPSYVEMQAKQFAREGGRILTLHERFLAKVAVQDDGCWKWTGSHIRKSGYGHICVEGRWKYAHRVAYELYVGPIPDGLQVCHTCDNPFCVNPEHLFAGTQKDNIQDAIAKGRYCTTNLPPTPTGEAHPGAKLTEEHAREILQLHRSGVNQYAIAKQYGIPRSTVNNIVTRRNWKHISE